MAALLLYVEDIIVTRNDEREKGRETWFEVEISKNVYDKETGETEVFSWYWGDIFDTRDFHIETKVSE